MPIKQAGFKSVRQSKKRHLRNLGIASGLKTKIKRFETLITEKNKEKAESTFSELISKIDKAKSKGILRKNTANRKKSRLAKKLARLAA